MTKSLIRKKNIQIRKKKYSNRLSIEPNKILNFLKNKRFDGKILGGYYPYNHEIDSLNILKFFEKKKIIISLPKISKNNQMNFFKWSFKDPLSVNSYGIPEPVSSSIVYPDILLIPLVAFNKDLFRLGYGGGYYDRYIAKVSKKKIIKKIGLGFSFQKVSSLPIEKHDIKLDFIVTEKNTYR